MIDPSHPESTCQDCGGANVTWFVAPPLWNQVIRPEGETKPDPILCPTCFMLRAEKVIGEKTWMILPK